MVDIGSLDNVGAPTWRAKRLFRTGGAGDTPWFRVKTARLFPDGRVAVGDDGTKAISILSDKGSLLRTLGGQGQGPGEFVAIRTLHEAPDGQLVAYDDRLRRLTWFDSTGKVVATKPYFPPDLTVDLQPLAVDGDHTVLSIYGSIRNFRPEGTARDTTPLFLADLESGAVDTLGHWATTEWSFGNSRGSRVRTYVGFSPTLTASGRSGRLAIGDTDSLNVTVMDYRGSVQMKVTGGGPHISSTPEEGERWRQENVRKLSESSPDILVETFRNAPYHDTYPAFDGVVIDDLGRLWISGPTRFEDRETRWIVLAPDGHAVGTVLLPAREVVLDIASNRVVTVAADALDVQEVTVYEVKPPK